MAPDQEVFELGAEGGEFGADLAEDLGVDGWGQAFAGAGGFEGVAVGDVACAEGVELGAVFAFAGVEFGAGAVTVVAGAGDEEEAADGGPQGGQEGDL